MLWTRRVPRLCIRDLDLVRGCTRNQTRRLLWTTTVCSVHTLLNLLRPSFLLSSAFFLKERRRKEKKLYSQWGTMELMAIMEGKEPSQDRGYRDSKDTECGDPE